MIETSLYKGDSASGSKPTIQKLLDENNEGEYVFNVLGHIAAAKNGKVYDTWDSSNQQHNCNYQNQFKKRNIWLIITQKPSWQSDGRKN